MIEQFTRAPVAATTDDPGSLAELTPREREVFALLVQGLSNPEICHKLVISEATAKTHVARVRPG